MDAVEPAFAAHVEAGYEAQFDEAPEDGAVKVYAAVREPFVHFAFLEVPAELADLLGGHASPLSFKPSDEEPAGCPGLFVAEKEAADVLFSGKGA